MSPSQARSRLQQSATWQSLRKLQAELSRIRIRDLFADNPRRFEEFSLEAPELLLDYSKHLITQEVLELLLQLAEEAGVTQAIEAMFTGEIINNTEHRQVLHVALRSPNRQTAEELLVHETLDRIEAFTEKLQSGVWTGFSGKAITDVINIGIGGSDLGPAMVYEALHPFPAEQLRCHFVSNVDPAHLQQTLARLNPETSLFIIASKTFTTLETLQNAEAARRWILSATDETQLAKHFVAVSSNVSKASDFGINPDNIFPMWDWVGGRYSLWSAIGLPIALGTSMTSFRNLLAGAHAMDEHFRTAEPAQNMPLLMALLNIWYLNFWGAESQVILPYAQNLHLFPAYLQQLDMESLGKSVHKDGSVHELATGGLLWGSAGTNGQHSFHQLLHQGTHLVPADFIACLQSYTNEAEQQQHLLANCFAQSQALMDGKSLNEAREELAAQGLSPEDVERLAPHKVIPGNRPSSTILMQRLSPQVLGSLVAAYEHRVYAQSVILDINAFDQWGVELGKVLSRDLFSALNETSECKRFDASTNALVNASKNRQ
jgi:glucose-6-phosphate isomerase